MDRIGVKPHNNICDVRGGENDFVSKDNGSMRRRYLSCGAGPCEARERGDSTPISTFAFVQRRVRG